MTSQDYEYYAKREQQERESADRCDDQSARRIHLEMANRYSSMLRQMMTRQVQA